MRKRQGAKSQNNRHPVTTATQCRSAIFAPTLRPTADAATVVVETAWARATISRVRLTQVHRDILDVLFTHFEPHYREDGSCAFLFHPYALLKKLHVTGNNTTWLRSKFDDLEIAGLEVRTPTYTVRTSIVRKHAWTADARQYAVVLETEYMGFFQRDLHVHSEKLTDKIIALRHAPTKALVRFMISHMSWNRSIVDTLGAIGYTGGERNRRIAVAKITSEAAVLARDFGIHVRDGRVTYTKHGEVWFENPPAAGGSFPIGERIVPNRGTDHSQ